MTKKIKLKLAVILFTLALAIQGSGSVMAQSIEVGTIERPPFATQSSDGSWTGFSVELTEEIAKRNDQTIQWKSYDVFNDMIADTIDGKVDLSSANISITSDREKQLDYSVPIYESGLQIFTPASASGASTLQVIWRSGLVQFVGLAFLILIVVAHLVWFFERDKKGKKRGQDYFRDQYKGGIWDAFWWAFIIVTIGGFENERPERPVGRLLAIFWIVASIFFISTFTAKITTALTVAQLQNDIESVQDLYGRKVGAPKGTSIANFLDSQNIKYDEYDDFTQVIQAVENEELEAGVGDAPVVQYYAATNPNSNLVLAGDTFNADLLAIAFPEDSELLEDFNQTLVELKEDGVFNDLEEKYFGSLNKD